MLLKLTQSVLVAGQPKTDYRAYSKACPPPPPPPQPKRWVNKEVCGTKTVTVSLGTQTVRNFTTTVLVVITRYFVPGYFDKTTIDTGTVSGAFQYGTFPFCIRVKVYE